MGQRMFYSLTFSGKDRGHHTRSPDVETENRDTFRYGWFGYQDRCFPRPLCLTGLSLQRSSKKDVSPVDSLRSHPRCPRG